MHFPPFSRHWQVFGTARTDQGRALRAAKRTLDGEDRSGPWRGRDRRGLRIRPNSTAEASNLPAMTELSPQGLYSVDKNIRRLTTGLARRSVHNGRPRSLRSSNRVCWGSQDSIVPYA